jgi:phospholipase C
MPAGNGLPSIEHIVVLMLENRSFDHMLGFLYTDNGNVSPLGQPYEGLNGTESKPRCREPSHLQQIQAELISRRFPAGQNPAPNATAVTAHLTSADYASYIAAHSSVRPS